MRCSSLARSGARLATPLVSLPRRAHARAAAAHRPRSCSVYEEINNNVIVVGDFKAYHKDNPSQPVHVDVIVSRCAR